MPNPTYTVLSTMKNEAPYILEWVAHYKTLGFNYIVVCTNDCSDPTVEILLRLQELGVVFHHPTDIQRGGIQRSALRQGVKVNAQVKKSTWYFVCDADELLNIHIGDGSIQALVEQSGDHTDCICIPWRNFSPYGVEEIKDELMTEQFTKGELPYNPILRPKTGKFVKSVFCNRKKYKRLGLHKPVILPEYIPTVKTTLPGGIPYIVNGERTEYPPSYRYAQVNHYALRSLDGFLVKRDRGRANHMHQTLGKEYWERFTLDSEEDRSIDRYKDQKSKFLKRLYADPQLIELHMQSVAWHQEKALEIKSDPENAAMIKTLRDLNQFAKSIAI